MAENEKRFKVSIGLRVDQISPEAKTYFDAPICYPDINYDGVVMIEGLLVEALQKLVQVGIARTEDPAAIMATFGKQPAQPIPSKR